MQKIILLLVFLTAACVAQQEPLSENNSSSAEGLIVSNLNSFSREIVPLKDHCQPDTFLANQIPADYEFNPECPPRLIWPPHSSILPDPGPMTNLTAQR